MEKKRLNLKDCLHMAIALNMLLEDLEEHQEGLAVRKYVADLRDSFKDLAVEAKNRNILYEMTPIPISKPID